MMISQSVQVLRASRSELNQKIEKGDQHKEIIGSVMMQVIEKCIVTQRIKKGDRKKKLEIKPYRVIYFSHMEYDYSH